MPPITYYVDSNVSYGSTVANNGLSLGAPWGGASGLQRACFVSVPGDTIKVVYGTTMTGANVLEMTLTGAQTGTMNAGDAVTGGASGTGFLIGKTAVLAYVCTTGGTWGSTGRLTSTTSGGYQDYTAVAITGITPTSGDSTTGRTVIIGVDASGNNDYTTQAVLNATGCSFGFVNANYNRWENIRVNSSSSHAWNNGSIVCVFVNCMAYQPGASGFYNCYTSQFFRCIVESPATFGWYVNNSCMLMDCKMSLGNAAYAGIHCAGVGHTIANCLIVNCNGIGIAAASSTNVSRCIIDGNVGDGIFVTTGANGASVYSCRISSNGSGNAEWGGIRAVAVGSVCYANRNVFYNSGQSGNAHVINVNGDEIGGLSAIAADTTELGYKNRAGGDWGLTAQAIHRRVGIPIDALNIDYSAAGITPDDKPGGGGAGIKTGGQL